MQIWKSDNPRDVMGLDLNNPRWDEELDSALERRIAQVNEAANHDDDAAAPFLARLHGCYQYLKGLVPKMQEERKWEEDVDNKLKMAGLYGKQELAWEKRPFRVGSLEWQECVYAKQRKLKSLRPANAAGGVHEQSGSCCSAGAR